MASNPNYKKLSPNEICDIMMTLETESDSTGEQVNQIEQVSFEDPTSLRGCEEESHDGKAESGPHEKVVRSSISSNGEKTQEAPKVTNTEVASGVVSPVNIGSKGGDEPKGGDEESSYHWVAKDVTERPRIFPLTAEKH